MTTVAPQYPSPTSLSVVVAAQLQDFFQDDITHQLLELPAARLKELLVNDAYKPRMHRQGHYSVRKEHVLRMYAQVMGGVSLDFALHVRKSPIPLDEIQRQDPELWEAFLQECEARLGVGPYPQAVCAALALLFDHFDCNKAMLRRAAQHGVAPIAWRRLGAEDRPQQDADAGAQSSDEASVVGDASVRSGTAFVGGGDASRDGGSGGGELTAFSHGPAEASSHVETTLTQLVQELVVQAQVRRLSRKRGIALTPSHLLGNSLAKLARGVERLNAEVAGAPALSLFAGRRSSSRRYLVLQNWYCRKYMRRFSGTSAVFHAALLNQLLQQKGASEEERQGAIGPLSGTLAHEVMMATDQLMGCYDDLHELPEHAQQRVQHEPQHGAQHGSPQGANGSTFGDGPTQICSLLAHLLLLRSSQDYEGSSSGQSMDSDGARAPPLRSATVLPDTFGTKGFVSAAVAARIPAEFLKDMREGQPGGSQLLPPGVSPEEAVVFDLFDVWRMDSGSYEEMASYVRDGWEQRWAHRDPDARPPPPILMHSNLSSVDEIIQLSRQVWRSKKWLPERIRPAVYAFGTLADGFLPFDAALGAQQADWGAVPAEPAADEAEQAQQEQATIKLCSVVMKAIQASHPGLHSCSLESAGKVGDDANHSKMQLDRRLPLEAQARTRDRLLALAQERQVDPDKASAALAAAYHAVTREGVLSEEAAKRAVQ
ncbi:hypothetical protein N2152v2_003364 [Parachlorella kessleri]